MKPDPEMQEMPKRSIKDDRAKAMIGGVKPKPKPKKSSIAKGPTGGRAGSSDIDLAKKGAPVNIPIKDISSDFKRLVVEELIRTGRARIVKRKGREGMAEEEEKKRRKQEKK